MPAVGAAQTPLSIPNAQSPMAVVQLDPTTGSPTGVYNYTAITTAGTTTLKSTPGVFGGLSQTALGTGFAAVVYDIGTATNIILGTQTSTLLGGLLGGTATGGIRTTGTMVVVTTGTPGSLLALWD